LVAEASNFLTFVGVIVVINMCAVAWGMLVSSMANSVQQGGAIAPLFIIVFLLFGGFYINTDNIPSAITWVQEISMFKWGFKAMTKNEYTNLVFVNAEGTPCTQVALANLSSGPQACAYVDGTQVLELLNFAGGSISECVLYLAIITASVHALAYCCLVSKQTKFAPLEPASLVRSDPVLTTTTTATTESAIEATLDASMDAVDAARDLTAKGMESIATGLGPATRAVG